MGIVSKIFGTHSENELKRIRPIADKIEALDEQMQALSDEELKHKTVEFKESAENQLTDIKKQELAEIHLKHLPKQR